MESTAVSDVLNHLQNPLTLWTAAICFGLGVLGTLLIAVLIFSRIVRHVIKAHENEERELNTERLRADEKRHQDRLQEDLKRHREREEDAARRHNETRDFVRQIVENASRFPAQVAAQYDRLNRGLDALDRRLDEHDEKIDAVRGDLDTLKTRFDTFIQRGGIPTP